MERIKPRIVNIDLDHVEMMFDVSVRNNAVIALPVPKGSYSVAVADKNIIQSVDVPPSNIPPAQTGTVTLPATIQYVDIWKAAKSLSNAGEVPYELAGDIVLELLGQQFPLTLRHEGELPVMRVPKISNIDWERPSFSLSGADIKVSASLTNPNVFELGLTNLGCEVRFGDMVLGAVDINTDQKIQPGQTAALVATCHVSSTSAATQLLNGGDWGSPKVTLVGSLDTPFGPVTLKDVQNLLNRTNGG
ncbi:MAG: LEA type 2 family protein [Phycisphaerae bacterium]